MMYFSNRTREKKQDAALLVNQAVVGVEEEFLIPVNLFSSLFTQSDVRETTKRIPQQNFSKFQKLLFIKALTLFLSIL